MSNDQHVNGDLMSTQVESWYHMTFTRQLPRHSGLTLGEASW
jgi:hypothetical protein